MPALTGSLSYTRFFVQGELPDDFRQRFMRAIRLRTIKPLSADEDALERFGWWAIAESREGELDYADVFFDTYLNLGFRTDRWVLSGSLVRAKLREAEVLYRAKKGRERLSRQEKTELKQLVVKKLRKLTMPAMRTVDLSWSLEEGIVRFFSQSPRTILNMSELFKKTFHLELVAESPYTLAARLGLDEAQEKAWEDLTPTLFMSGER
jgi:recombination associated protein RdgC